MLACFGISQKGASHLAHGKECQDYSVVRRVRIEDGREYVVAAIADGVGSADFSRIGARTAVIDAVKSVVGSLKNGAEGHDDDRMRDILEHSFRWACKSVEEKSGEDELPFVLMDSTLTVAVYDGLTMWFGHVGDDGIVVMRNNGEYYMATTRHKGKEASSVSPLRDTGRWQFGKVEEVASFVMMTDGMLDYCVDKEVMGNRVYLPFLYPLLYKTLDTEEEERAYRGEWVRFLWGGDGKTPPSRRVSNEHNASTRDVVAVDGQVHHVDVETDGEQHVGDKTDAGDNGSLRIRDYVYDDITVVLVENSESVDDLPTYSFDYEQWTRASRERAKTRDDALRRMAEERMREQRGEQEQGRGACKEPRSFASAGVDGACLGGDKEKAFPASDGEKRGCEDPEDVARGCCPVGASVGDAGGREPQDLDKAWHGVQARHSVGAKRSQPQTAQSVHRKARCSQGEDATASIIIVEGVKQIASDVFKAGKSIGRAVRKRIDAVVSAGDGGAESRAGDGAVVYGDECSDAPRGEGQVGERRKRHGDL